MEETLRGRSERALQCIGLEWASKSERERGDLSLCVHYPLPFPGEVDCRLDGASRHKVHETFSPLATASSSQHDEQKRSRLQNFPGIVTALRLAAIHAAVAGRRLVNSLPGPFFRGWLAGWLAGFAGQKWSVDTAEKIKRFVYCLLAGGLTDYKGPRAKSENAMESTALATT